MKKNWEIKKLGEVCEKASSNIVLNKIESEEFDGDYPLYGASGLVKNINFHHRDTEYIGIIKDGSGVGRVGIYPAYSSLVGTMQYIIPNDAVKIKFLYYVLNNLKLDKYVSGAAIPHIYFKDYRNENIPLPPQDIQERIVGELDLLSGVIEKKKQQLKELDTLAQALFYDMFGDPVSNEKGWEVKKLGEVCTSELGKTLNSAKDTGEPQPYLCAVNVQWGRFDFTTLKSTKFEPSEYERYSVRKGDLLICEGGDVGRAAIWDKDDTILYQNALHRVRFFNNEVPCFFLYCLLILKQKGTLDEKYSKGVTIKHLVKSSLLSIPVPLPPLSLQQSFAEKISAIEQQKSLIKQSLAEAETLLSSRMSYYFD